MAASRTNLPVCENLQGVYVKGCSEVYASSEEEVFELVKKASLNRAVSCTSTYICT